MLLVISLAATLALFLPLLWFSPVYDDVPLVLTNPLLHSWSSVPFYFTHNMWSHLSDSHGKYYRPLNMLFMIAAIKLFGVNLWGFRLVSLVFFLGMIVAVFLFAREIGLSSAAAGWSALLFAVHPIHMETAGGLTDNLANMLMVFALVFYRRAQESRHWNWFFASAGSYLLALLSKEPTIVFPGLALLAEFVWRSTIKKNAAIRLLTLSGISLMYLAIRARVLGAVAPTQSNLSWPTAIRTVPALLVFYFQKLVLPLNLSLFYDQYPIDSWRSPQFLLSLLLVLATLVLLFVSWKRTWLTKAEWFCIAACLVCLAPMLDLAILLPTELVHDRYDYLPSVFFVVLVASVVSRVAELRVWILCGTATLLAILCETQIWNYKDELTAMIHSVHVAPNNAGAAGKAAVALYEHGYHEEARRLLDRVTVIAPTWYDAYFDLAQMDLDDGVLDEAEKRVRKAIALMPQRRQAHSLLAKILAREGRKSEAEEELKLAQAAQFN